jgi:hypothetical protein
MVPPPKGSGMKTATLLHILLTVHTLIAAASIFCLFYLYYSAWKGHHPSKDKLLLLALVWPFVNLIVLTCNGWVCPLQNAAQALTGEHAAWVRDIYWVPESWLRVVPWTYGSSYAIGAALVWWRSGTWLRSRPSPNRPGRA